MSKQFSATDLFSRLWGKNRRFRKKSFGGKKNSGLAPAPRDRTDDKFKCSLCRCDMSSDTWDEDFYSCFDTLRQMPSIQPTPTDATRQTKQHWRISLCWALCCVVSCRAVLLFCLCCCCWRLLLSPINITTDTPSCYCIYHPRNKKTRQKLKKHVPLGSE